MAQCRCAKRGIQRATGRCNSRGTWRGTAELPPKEMFAGRVVVCLPGVRFECRRSKNAPSLTKSNFGGLKRRSIFFSISRQKTFAWWNNLVKAHIWWNDSIIKLSSHSTSRSQIWRIQVWSLQISESTNVFTYQTSQRELLLNVMFLICFITIMQTKSCKWDHHLVQDNVCHSSRASFSDYDDDDVDNDNDSFFD